MNYDKIKKSLESYVLKISNGIFDFVVVDLSYHNCCGCGNTHTGFKIEVVVNFSKISSDIHYFSYENYFEDLFYKDIVTFFKMLNPNSKFFFYFTIKNKFTLQNSESPLLLSTAL